MHCAIAVDSESDQQGCECVGTGLTDRMREDRRVMMALGGHVRLNPTTRVERLIALRRQIQA